MVAQVQSVAWERLHALGVVKKKERERERRASQDKHQEKNYFSGDLIIFSEISMKNKLLELTREFSG